MKILAWILLIVSFVMMVPPEMYAFANPQLTDTERYIALWPYHAVHIIVAFAALAVSYPVLIGRRK